PVTHHAAGPERPGHMPGGEDRWPLVATAGVLSFVSMLDMNIVNVALADIADGLHISAATAQWTVLAYQLPVVALLLPVGRWLDGTGPRFAVVLATAGFGLCSALAAAAPWAAWLIAARLAQGTFGAVLFVLMPVLAIRSVRPHLRGRAMSVPATLGPLGAVTGPAVGGLLLDHWGWRSVFLVKIPFCVLALAVVMAVPSARPESEAAGDGRPRLPGRRSCADALLVATGVAALLLALTLASRGPYWPALAIAAGPPLWWWLRGPGGRPMTRMLRTNGLLRAHGAVLALAVGFAAMHYVVALQLQRGDGVSATTTGLTVLAFPLAMALAGPLGGRLADLPHSRLRSSGGTPTGARRVAVTGAALTAAGLLLLVPLGEGLSPLDTAWRLALAGVGMGLNGGPTQALVMGTAPPDRTATVGSTVQLARSLGFTLGPALATAAWAIGGARAGLALAATAASLAVPLLALPGRRPAPGPENTTDAAPAAHH
ncbi:MFS transporter, partial [Streptomyces sp. NPDC058964]|uniref:MFS transporter n=1 Tax=Streptomyces sp. NPDC058964 TaxID=3346681 RepID=UPI0036C67560